MDEHDFTFPGIKVIRPVTARERVRSRLTVKQIEKYSDQNLRRKRPLRMVIKLVDECLSLKKAIDWQSRAIELRDKQRCEEIRQLKEQIADKNETIAQLERDVQRRSSSTLRRIKRVFDEIREDL